MKVSVKTTVTVPSAFVSKNRQRLKQFDNTVYLNNGNEFEIELFNPTINKVLAVIELNGKSIGSGVVLRPGERVFLERYLDDPKKFKFETYTVNGSSDEVKRAIANNGNVTVKFYAEQPVYPYNHYRCCISPTYVYQPAFPSYSPIFTCGGTVTMDNFSGASTLTTSNFLNTSVGITNTAGSITASSTHTPESKFKSLKSLMKTRSKEVETGRVEKGSHSDQSFVYDSTTFYSWHSWMSEWTILPLSQKHLTKEDLKVYCTGCGSKRKKDNHKFCPNCGTEY